MQTRRNMSFGSFVVLLLHFAELLCRKLVLHFKSGIPK